MGKKKRPRKIKEAIDAVCGQFGVRLEELAATGAAAREDVRAARAACLLLAVPLGLSVVEMGRRIGYSSKHLWSLRRHYWGCYRYGRRGFKSPFQALCIELRVPCRNLSELRQALGFGIDTARSVEVIEAVCASFELNPDDLRLTGAGPLVRRACAVCAVLARKTGVLLRRKLGSGESDLRILCDLGCCLLRASRRRGSSQDLKALHRGYEQACRRLGVDVEIPEDCDAGWLV